MKKSTLFLIIPLLLIGFSGAVSAGKNAKTIRHCGCVYDSLSGTDMIFHDINIAGKSQGHRNHVAESDDLCFAGLDDNGDPQYEMWARDSDDCMISGTNSNLVACDGSQVEFESCGSPVE